MNDLHTKIVEAISELTEAKVEEAINYHELDSNDSWCPSTRRIDDATDKLHELLERALPGPCTAASENVQLADYDIYDEHGP